MSAPVQRRPDRRVIGLRATVALATLAQLLGLLFLAWYLTKP